MTKSYHINELAVSLIVSCSKELELFVIIVGVKWTFYYSSIKHYKLKKGEENIGGSQEPLWTLK